MKEKKINLITAWFISRKLRKQEKSELIAMIEDLDLKVRTNIDKAVRVIEELNQEKLYFVYADVDHETIKVLKHQFAVVKKMMNWSAPNILVMNTPIIELSEEKLKELEKIRKNLRGKNNGKK